MNSAITSSPSASFVGQLYAMVRRDDRAALAHLRRCRGRLPGEVASADSVFFSILPAEVSQRDVHRYWLVAGLFAQAQAGGQSAHEERAEPKRPRNLAASLRAIAADESRSKGVARRLRTLLDARADELEPHLRGAVALARTAGVAVDWHQLLRDLLAWDHPDRTAQRSWARSYWGLSESRTDDSATPATTED